MRKKLTNLELIGRGMKLYSRFLFCLFFLNWTSAQAQITPENSVTPGQAELYVRSIPLGEINAYVQQHGAPYVYDDGRVSQTGLTAATSQTEYAWRFRGQDVFYSYIEAFRPDVDPPPLCRADAPSDKALTESDCVVSTRAFVQCHLFIFDVNRNLVAVQPLTIPQPDYIEAKPSCFDVHAIAPAQVVKDGMLIVASYYDSRWTCNAGQYCASNSPAAFPDPLYKTTFLVRFDKDAEGKMVLSQDDSCLGSLNNYSTIAGARKALKKAGCK